MLLVERAGPGALWPPPPWGTGQHRGGPAEVPPHGTAVPSTSPGPAPVQPARVSCPSPPTVPDPPGGAAAPLAVMSQSSPMMSQAVAMEMA